MVIRVVLLIYIWIEIGFRMRAPPTRAPALRLVELLRRGELLPERAVALRDPVADGDRVDVFLQSSAPTCQGWVRPVPNNKSAE